MPYREIAQDWPIRKIPGPRGGAWEMCLATDGSKHQDGSLLDARDSEELSMSRYRQVGLSSAWRRCGRPIGPTPAVEAPAGLAFFQKLPPCLEAIEACASSHHWSRELQALRHTVRLMPAACVKPHVKQP